MQQNNKALMKLSIDQNQPEIPIWDQSIRKPTKSDATPSKPQARAFSWSSSSSPIPPWRKPQRSSAASPKSSRSASSPSPFASFRSPSPSPSSSAPSSQTHLPEP
ncbi:hypothetical protein TorRG33x02_045260 [Trema orientale]|uniref:Uncharacterized protein n=1 Tax=Trema orientale TaxID=63057 RepID=A0A2P5FPN3_TREOI|nr:hypothetical protein TorRG33x02_045260 [Trema orientale]